ncbi:hypothetical protein E2C01_024002 [Portunus trituberculatus]|uniref:Uncharacterized protein n=1 Tax=Portunus trituberculatus TaxID=210409 RepID=A0A5B7ECP3_PORTR|nr:hypothetical protein [Portunus trituberculatus]
MRKNRFSNRVVDEWSKFYDHGVLRKIRQIYGWG